MRAWTLCLLYSLLVGSVYRADAVTPLVIEPTKTGRMEAALIIVPGAGLSGEAYRPLAQTIQQRCPLKLWVVLLKDFVHDPVNGVIPSFLDVLYQQGMSSNNVFLAGHSFGGFFVGQDGKVNPNRYKGILLFAAYLTKGMPLATYPIPVLTISGDLDGLTRITRIADEFQQLQAAVATSRTWVYNTPVIVMRGVNHAQFASGTMPAKVVSYDLAPEVRNKAAWRIIARHTSAFLVATLRAPQRALTWARRHLDVAYRDTSKIMEPLLRLKSLNSNAENSDKWTIQAQLFEAGPIQQQLTITNTILPDPTAFQASRPTISSNCSTVTIATFTHVTYNLTASSITPTAPRALMIKLKSREAIQSVSPGSDRSSTVSTCKSLNKAAFYLALNNSSADAQRRFKAKGRPIIFENDENVSTGLAWSTAELGLHEDDRGLRVTSPALKTSLHEALEAFSGMHYCTVLAPYRAMEWIYVDSLRSHPVNYSMQPEIQLPSPAKTKASRTR